MSYFETLTRLILEMAHVIELLKSLKKKAAEIDPKKLKEELASIRGVTKEVILNLFAEYKGLLRYFYEDLHSATDDLIKDIKTHEYSEKIIASKIKNYLSTETNRELGFYNFLITKLSTLKNCCLDETVEEKAKEPKETKEEKESGKKPSKPSTSGLGLFSTPNLENLANASPSPSSASPSL